MNSISSMIGHSLRWVRPSVFKQMYELRAGEECIATLVFPKALSRVAHAESRDGCWTFEEKGFWTSRIIVRQCDQEIPIVTLTLKQFGRVNAFSLPRWRTVRISNDFWRSDYSLSTDMGELLVSLKVKPFRKHAGEVELGRKGESYPELPWLMFLLWYVAIIRQRRAAAAG